MQVSCNQLDAHLKKTLDSLYLISGDDPLLVQDVRDNIIAAAQSHGFSDKETMHIDSNFHIESLIESIQNQNLFSEKKIIDLRNPSAKCDAEMLAVLQQYLAHPFSDRLLIMSTEKLTPAQQKSTWFDCLKKQAVFIPVWPITSDALPAWIIQRAKKLHLVLPLDMANLIAYYCEGNLLAAKQTLEKLQIQYPNTSITKEQIIAALSFDQARFGLFDLSTALRNGDTKKIIRILTRLEQTGEEPVLVLWHITRFIRDHISAHKNTDKMKKALQQAATVDAIIKGGAVGDSWQSLLALSLQCQQ